MLFKWTFREKSLYLASYAYVYGCKHVKVRSIVGMNMHSREKLYNTNLPIKVENHPNYTPGNQISPLRFLERSPRALESFCSRACCHSWRCDRPALQFCLNKVTLLLLKFLCTFISFLNKIPGAWKCLVCNQSLLKERRLHLRVCPRVEWEKWVSCSWPLQGLCSLLTLLIQRPLESCSARIQPEHPDA